MRNTSVIAAATPAPTMIHGLTEYCLYLPRFSFLSLSLSPSLSSSFFFSKISSPSVRDERVSSRSRLVSRKKKMGSAFEFFEAITHSLPRSSFNEHSMRIHGCFFHEKVFSNEISTVFFSLQIVRSILFEGGRRKISILPEIELVVAVFIVTQSHARLRGITRKNRAIFPSSGVPRVSLLRSIRAFTLLI